MCPIPRGLQTLPLHVVYGRYYTHWDNSKQNLDDYDMTPQPTMRVPIRNDIYISYHIRCRKALDGRDRSVPSPPFILMLECWDVYVILPSIHPGNVGMLDFFIFGHRQKIFLFCGGYIVRCIEHPPRGVCVYLPYVECRIVCATLYIFIRQDNQPTNETAAQGINQPSSDRQMGLLKRTRPRRALLKNQTRTKTKELCTYK